MLIQDSNLSKQLMSYFQEKLKVYLLYISRYNILVRYYIGYIGIFEYLPVPETDTGREVEHTKGRERTLLKELGKMTL